MVVGRAQFCFCEDDYQSQYIKSVFLPTSSFHFGVYDAIDTLSAALHLSRKVISSQNSGHCAARQDFHNTGTC
jgi:hypothetical protein